jgi:2Fe-2S ferredoxin
MSLSEVTFWPDQKKIQVRPGTSLFTAARKARVTIPSRCGEKAACLMCKVKVELPNGLAPAGQNERNKLGTMIDEGYRLACQATVFTDTTVSIPEDRLKAIIRAQLAKQQEEADGI